MTNTCEKCHKTIGEKGKIYIAGTICQCQTETSYDLNSPESEIIDACEELKSALLESYKDKKNFENHGVKMKASEKRVSLAKDKIRSFE